MAETEIQGTFRIGDQEMTIAEIAGIDISAVREVRAVRVNPGLYRFKIADCEFVKMEIGEEKIPTIAIATSCEILEVALCYEWPSKVRIEDPDVIKALIEKKHYERFVNKNDILAMIGAYKAFLVDVGFTTGGEAAELQAIMQACVGYEFWGVIKWSRNQNDPDMPYINLNRSKVGEAAAKKELEKAS